VTNPVPTPGLRLPDADDAASDDERVKMVLSEISARAKRREPGGVSLAAMARDLGVSDKRMFLLASLEHIHRNVNLRLGQVRRLRRAVRCALLAVVGAREDAPEESPRTPGEVRARLEAIVDDARARGVLTAADVRAFRVAVRLVFEAVHEERGA
jgi:hypothetical protein